MAEGRSTPDSNDMDLLHHAGRKRGGASRLIVQGVVALFAVIFALLITTYFVQRSKLEVTEIAQLNKQLLETGSAWGENLSLDLSDYSQWFVRHGTQTEAQLFNDISAILIGNALASPAAYASAGEIGLLSQIYLSLHEGLLRLSFLIIASLRVWIVACIVALFFGLRYYRAYVGADALGQMGNGRLFYSGARASLDAVTPEGAPDIQIRGLACPQFSTAVEARASGVWRVLNEYGAVNGTNEALTAIIVKNGAIAPYVALQEEESLLATAFATSSIKEHTEDLLSAALSLHALYAAGEVHAGLEEPHPSGDAQPLNSEEYALLVRAALHRVLTPALRQELGRIPAAEVATTILALECGKVLVHSYEGGRWIRRSNFPHLSARAVLHSVLEYPQDYSFDARSRIRRSLIYAARSSAFAPVRMPVDLRSDVWGLRQWMEIFLACPHELIDVADEVELVGLVRVSHIAWSSEFLESSIGSISEIAQNSYATGSDLLFIPVARVVALLRETLKPLEIRRMEVLLAAASSRQRLKAIAVEKGDSASFSNSSLERIMPPLSNEEVLTLEKLHAISAQELRDWSAMRIVLASYGWLARRVGDYTVPDSSVIFSVFKSKERLEGANSLGLLGKAGMVPLRGAKLEQRWGRSWSSRFKYADKATMSETTEDYEKLLQGIEEKPEDDSLSELSPASA